MTDQMIEQQTDLGPVLDRVYRAMDAPYRHITTDGLEYSPTTEMEIVAAELGFHHKRNINAEPGTPERRWGTFTPDTKMAEWRKKYRLGTSLRILRKAGADPADLETLRQLLGVEERDEAFADKMDNHSEEVDRHWLEQYQRGHAISLVNAREAGRREVLADLQKVAGSGLLDKRGNDFMGLDAEVRHHVSTVAEHGVTPLSAALLNPTDGDTITVPGMLTNVIWRITKQGRHWATAMLTDGEKVELLMHPDEYEKACGFVKEGARVLVTARVTDWQYQRMLTLKTMTADNQSGDASTPAAA